MRKKAAYLLALVMTCCMLVTSLCGCATNAGGKNGGTEDVTVATANAEAEPEISGEATAGPESELAGNDVRVDDTDGNKDIGGDYGLGDPDADDEDDQTEAIVEEPEEEVPAAGGHGGYQYEVGDTVIYTDNPADKWVRYDEEHSLYILDVWQMLTDLWCTDGGTISGNYSSYFFIDKNGEPTGGVYFEVPDADYSYLFHSFTLYRTVNGENHATTVTVYSYDSDVFSNDKCILSDPLRSIGNEMAILLQKAAEEAAKDPERNNVLSGLTPGSNYLIDDFIRG